jgi:hypothetical protein
MKFKSVLQIAAGAAFIIAASSSLQAGTEIVDGYKATIAEITSPDDLHLDPDSLIIAVDAYGDEDREVNGALFQTDRCDGCPDTEGEVENAGVTYRSISTHFIDGWAVPPNFTGGVGDSADNLSAIMEDIRWSAAPSAVTIELEGLPASAELEIQLLFSEGADRNRRWDIGVVDGDPEDIDEDGLIFDDIQSEGISGDSDLGEEGVWTHENSFVATFTANANAAGELTVVMQQHIGGQDPPGGDNNPILQAAIVHASASLDPLAVGLVAYWPLDGNLEDQVADSHGEAVGGDDLEYAVGQFNEGVDLDGVDQHIVINEDNEEIFDFPDGNGFSVSAWFRVDAFTKSWQALVAKGEGNRWRVHRRGGESILTGNGGAADVPAGATDVNDEEIHLMVLVSDPEGVANDDEEPAVILYIDGEVEAIGPAPNLENNDRPMMIGENPDAASRTWDGLIDDVAAWNRPLSEDEVKRIWDEGQKGKSLGKLISNEGIDVVHGKETIEDVGGPDGWDLTMFVVDPLITSDDTEADGISDGTVTSWTAAFREDRADGEHTVAPVLAKRDTDSGEITVVGVGDLVAPEQGEESITLPWGVGTGSNMIDLTQEDTEWLMGIYQGGPNGNNAGAVVPFAGGGEYPMFAWDTADLPPEPDEVVTPGHASYDAPAAREYQFNFTVSWGGGTNPDRDGDGLPNFYEEANGLNPDDPADAASDGDNDGLTALQEFEKRTDITKADTDGDGLNDGVETGTGVWVSAADTGTDPRKADTDKDKLSDGVETNSGVFVSNTDTGTDPHKKDTDGDSFSDSNELANGSDPTKAASVPDLDPIEILGTGTDALLGGDLTDPEDDGDEFAGEDDPSWNWVSIESNDEPGFEGGEFSYNVFDNILSPGNGKWCCTNATEDNPLQLTVEFEEPVALTHFTISSANDVPTRDPLDWQIQGSNDGENFEPIFIREDDEPIWEDQTRFQVVLVTLQNIPPAYKFIRYEVTRTAGANHQLGELEYFGGPGTSVPFQITRIVRADDGNTLTWASRNGKEYSVEFIETLAADGWIELDDGVASEGEETSFTDDDPAHLAVPEGWYRVREN